MSEKTKEQIKEELKKGVEEIKKIRRGDRGPEWSQIIREIVQDGDMHDGNGQAARSNSDEKESSQVLQ